MTASEDEQLDADFAELLIAYDDALMAGSTHEPSNTPDAPTNLVLG